MKKKIRRGLAAASSAVLLLSGCGSDISKENGAETTVELTQSIETETPEFIEISDISAYSLVRPDVMDDELIELTKELRNLINKRMGADIQLTTDWVKRGESAPEGTLEILVGQTNRPESEALAVDEWEVGYKNGRIYINGGSEAALAKAIEYFDENCLGKTLVMASKPYGERFDYPLKDFKLAGAHLYDYRIRVGSADQAVADSLSNWIIEQTGHYPAKSSDRFISFEVDSTLAKDEIRVTAESGNIKLMKAADGITFSAAVMLLKEKINAAGDELAAIDEKEQIMIENVKECTAEKLAEWRALTDARIASIKASPNMEIPTDARVYYVSENGSDSNDGLSPDKAWKTLSKVSNASLAAGDYVCFERGGVWRGQLFAKAGVTYTAYGEGEKPKIYRSPFSGAEASLWTKTDAENIWQIKLDKNDVGTLVFNDGEAHAIKCVIRTEDDGSTYNNTTGERFIDYHDLTTDLHFFHDYYDTGILYLYSEQNPGERFDEIEFCSKQNAIAVRGDGVTIDNICVKYTGSHGVGAGTVKNLTVQNCEFGWIGGSIQAEGIFGRKYGTRFGNGVEIYGGCENYRVADCYFYQIYDAGITQQYSLTQENIDVGKEYFQKDVTYSGNVMEYCNYSIEYFLSRVPVGNNSHIENFLIENNYMWYAGYGFCEQRPDHGQAAHIKSWISTNVTDGYIVRDNLMIGGSDMLTEIYTERKNSNGVVGVPMFYNNNFCESGDATFGVVSWGENRQRIKYSDAVIDYLADHSNGDTFWFGTVLEK